VLRHIACSIIIRVLDWPDMKAAYGVSLL
jgi:hypothetical protein